MTDHRIPGVKGGVCGLAPERVQPKPIPKMAEIASRLQDHLTRIETAQANGGLTFSSYWHAAVWVAGSKIGVRYVSYQYFHKLTKAGAWAYLQWLDSGKVGKHHQMPEIPK